MGLEELGLTGNCRFSALVERTGSGVQCCLQRFDSERGFSTLLDERDVMTRLVTPPSRSVFAALRTSCEAAARAPPCVHRPPTLWI